MPLGTGASSKTSSRSFRWSAVTTLLGAKSDAGGTSAERSSENPSQQTNRGTDA
jgi:hypothetical protein